ncbi:MAG: isoprenylcysteine carboxylmethyltransferase family protein [Gemmatimonadaceae bacterium]|nr:isoprenylcysteine carboxylmethyltransferase family protein [Gemmatimonadaceae bacterium]
MLALVGIALRGFRYPENSHALDLQWELLCLAVALLGVGIRVVTVGHVPGGTSGRRTRSIGTDALNTTGLYSVVRHPLYLGNYLMWLGPAMVVRSWGIAVVVSLAFWLYYERIMLAEEEFLRLRFGEQFEAWASNTPAFIPKHTGWRPWGLSFSLCTAVKREASGLFALMSAFTAIEAGSDFAATGRIDFDPLWTVLFVTAATIYLAVIAARHTRLLHCHDR